MAQCSRAMTAPISRATSCSLTCTDASLVGEASERLACKYVDKLILFCF